MSVFVRLVPGSGLRARMMLVAVLSVLSVIYLSSPDGIGGVALFATIIAGLVAFAVGPLVHRPTNRRPWYWLNAAGALFLVGLLLRFGLLSGPGLIGNADLWTFAGYTCSAVFLRDLLRRTRQGPDPTLWLDTAAITTGSLLIGWVMNIAPQLSRASPQLGTTVVNTVYPVMDTMLLALTVQLAFRRGSGTPALQAAVAGLAAMLLGDLAYTFVWAADPGAVNPYVNVLYLVAYACEGLMAAHPSMRELSDVDATYTPRMTRPRLTFVFLAMVTPATIPIMLPTHGLLDGIVRAALMVVFGTLVHLRLLGTIRALRAAEAEAERRATHDALTGLPNRVALLERLDDHLSRPPAGDHGGRLNVFLLDCDHFKQINDSWGHAAGDEVLVAVAERLRSITGPDDLLARVGGDEFALVVADDDRATSAIATEILDVVAQPVTISAGRTTLLTASLGIAQSAGTTPATPLDRASELQPATTTTTATDLIRDADLALYEAKGRGRATFAVHDSSMHEKVARRHRLADSLRTALAHGEIGVAFQPIRSGPGFGDLIGWEALARWVHPEHGQVSPLEFIPLAEDTGLIVDIGDYVLTRAAAQLAQWQERYHRPDLHMSVNVSSVQLLRGDVVGLVSRQLARTGLAPGCLWLEITESVVLQRTEDVLRILTGLNGLGVKLSLDDFGTGYSSLAYLKDFRVDVLKVDRAFITNLAEDPRDRNLTRAMIDVATAMGLEGVVAEGVETPEQAMVLSELGCRMAQGYLFGRPAPAGDATDAADALLLPADPPSGAVPQPREPHPGTVGGPTSGSRG